MEIPPSPPPNLQPVEPGLGTPIPTSTHRKLRRLFSKNWLVLIFSLMAVIGLLYFVYLITAYQKTSPEPLDTPNQPSCQRIATSGELNFLQNYCTGYYCHDFITQMECEAVDVVSITSGQLSETSTPDGIPDCRWVESDTFNLQCQIAYP